MTYVLVPGAGGEAWYWHLVAPLLDDDAIAVDLPAADETAGLDDYADTIVQACGDRTVTLVAQSMGAFSAPLAAQRAEVKQIVLVAPMIPARGETPGGWWETSGYAESGAPPFDPWDTFFHDVPEAVQEEARRRGEPRQASVTDPWPLERWPDIPTRVIIGSKDRLFPEPFARRLSRERLGIEPDLVDAGHLPALSRPGDLARLLVHAAVD